MATGTNSRSDTTLTFTFSSAKPGDCFTDKQAREIERRLKGSLPAQSQVGDAVVSRTPPSDTTKIWYLADENGIPTGQQYRYNPRTQRWETTEASIPPIPCRSTNTENLISLDLNNCWLVDKNAIASIVQEESLFISTDSGNSLKEGADGGIYLSFGSFCFAEGLNFLRRNTSDCAFVTASNMEPNDLVEGSDGNMLVRPPKILDIPIDLITGASGGTPAGTFNLESVTTVPPWATHAIIYQPSGRMFARISTGIIAHDSLANAEVISLAGFIKAQP